MIFIFIGLVNCMVCLVEIYLLIWCLCEDVQFVWFEEYQSKDGYVVVCKVLIQMVQDDIVQIVKDFGFKGCGGVGFFIGVKWGLMLKDELLNICYLLCNVDEMELNIWKDCMFMEQLLYLLVEGMLIFVCVLKVYCGYIFLCGEYVDVVCNFNCVIDEVKVVGLFGKNIFGSGFDFELFVYIGVGCYICGEEIVLINLLEGCCVNLCFKLFFFVVVGVWGKLICVNNVEMLCNVLVIVGNGVDWYKILVCFGSEDMGIKLMGFFGKVKNFGLWELLFGVSVCELFEDYVGGMCDGFQFKVWQFGGVGIGFLFLEYLDVQMFVGGIVKVGIWMGIGLVMVVDDSINMVFLLCNMEEFFVCEFCGWCIFCCDGLLWSVKLLCVLEWGEGQFGDFEIFEQLVNFFGLGKIFCVYVLGVVELLGSVFKYFCVEFEVGIFCQFLVVLCLVMVGV